MRIPLRVRNQEFVRVYTKTCFVRSRSGLADSMMMTMQNLHRFASKGIDHLSYTLQRVDSSWFDCLTFSGSKFFFPSGSSLNSFPEPWPSSSWFATCTSKDFVSHALYRARSLGWMKG